MIINANNKYYIRIISSSSTYSVTENKNFYDPSTTYDNYII